MVAEHKALVRSFFEVQDREQRTPLALCSPDVTAHMRGAPPIDFAAFQQREAMTFAAFSNIRHHMHDLVAEGDNVAFRMTIEMTHTAAFMGIPASGKRHGGSLSWASVSGASPMARLPTFGPPLT